MIINTDTNHRSDVFRVVYVCIGCVWCSLDVMFKKKDDKYTTHTYICIYISSTYIHTHHTYVLTPHTHIHASHTHITHTHIHRHIYIHTSHTHTHIALTHTHKTENKKTDMQRKEHISNIRVKFKITIPLPQV